MPERTRTSQVRLRTARLERALEYYTGVLGLRAANGPGAQARLSGGPHQQELLVLSEDRNAAPRQPRSIGLYHFALRYRTRKDLARAYRRVVEAGYPITGASDHGVSEAIYLSDPDGNGVELYADRPRSQWHWQDGQIAMVTAALDLGSLLDTTAAGPKTAAPPQADLGHIHLHVANLPAAEQFYGEFLGLAVTQRSYPGALFFAGGDYHHHIAVNVWAGKNAPPANSAGLIAYRLEVPVAEILYCLSHRAPLMGYETRTAPPEDGRPILQIRDPNGTWLEIQAARNAAARGADSSWAGCAGAGEPARHLPSAE